MPTRVFLNAQALSPDAAVVAAPTNLTPVPFPAIVAGNILRFQFLLVDGFGAYDPDTGDPGSTVTLALGNVETQTVLTSETTFTSETVTIDGVTTTAWEVVLDCSGAGVTDYVSGQRSKTAFIEFEVVNADGDVNTRMQAAVDVLNRVNT